MAISVFDVRIMTLSAVMLVCTQGTFIPNLTPCMDGWVANNGSCYLFGHGTRMRFSETLHYCEHFGATMVHIDDIHENRFVMDFISSLKADYFWLGLSDEMVEGEWRWMDSNTIPTFTSWRPGQPNGGHEDCAGTESTYEWGDYDCDTDLYPMCEIKGNQEVAVVG